MKRKAIARSVSDSRPITGPIRILHKLSLRLPPGVKPAIAITVCDPGHRSLYIPPPPSQSEPPSE